MELCGRGHGKIAGAREEGDSKETVPSRHNGTDTRMNLQKLWQHAQGRHRFKLDCVPVLRGGSGPGFLPLFKKLSLINICLQNKQKSTQANKQKTGFLQWNFTGREARTRKGLSESPQASGREGGGKEGRRGTQVGQRGLTARFHYLENQKVFREKHFKVHLQFTSCLYN